MLGQLAAGVARPQPRLATGLRDLDADDEQLRPRERLADAVQLVPLHERPRGDEPLDARAPERQPRPAQVLDEDVVDAERRALPGAQPREPVEIDEGVGNALLL